MRAVFLLSLLGLSACCDGPPPTWELLDPVELGESLTLELAPLLEEESEDVVFTAQADAGLSAAIDGNRLVLTADADFEGTTSVRLAATDACGRVGDATLIVRVDPALAAESCDTVFRYTARGSPSAVYLAGPFNDWSTTGTPMEKDGNSWVASVNLAEGAWPYKVIEVSGGSSSWSCNPEEEQFQCDEGYTWDPSCSPGGPACNSLKVVQGCGEGGLSLSELRIDRDAYSLSTKILVEGTVSNGWVSLDGEKLSLDTSSDTWVVSATGLAPGRHSLRAGGDGIEELYLPFWMDGGSWEQGLLYYAFVDRFANGDPGLDGSEGVSSAAGDYKGGDWQGVIDRLDYLESLGVTAIWLTAPWDNADGAWAGDCGVTLSGYHGYWPSSDRNFESHFGDEATLKALIAAAHDKNMRVLVDWVGNHLHSEHPWVEEHPDWFTPKHICKDDDDGNGVVNWDQRPETCWFAGYLPDLNYYQTEPLQAMVDDAIRFAKDYEIDGYRVDAVKHMPHSVHWNMQSRIRSEIEHRSAGGDEDFYTVGETFTPDRGLISAYIGERELDGQFDFPLYWGIVAAFARDEIGLSNGDGSLKSVAEASESSFAGQTMSTFLGNHDVWRFVAQASGEVGSLYGDGNCDGNNQPWPADQPPGYAEPYLRLKLAWTFLLTRPGLPLIYYGDEIGLPGWADPDNRQMMRFSPNLSADEASVLAHVQTLGQARKDYPALSIGQTRGWWENEPDVYAYARVHEGDGALILLNRSDQSRTLSNGLTFAGLSSGSWTDLLSGQVFVSSGDTLSVELGPYQSRLLVKR